MPSTNDPYAVAYKGCRTNAPETIIDANQGPGFNVYTKDVLMCISGDSPLSAANPGQNRRSITVASNKCDKSFCKTFIKGDGVAHEYTQMDDSPSHYVDTGDDELPSTSFVTYVATGL